MIAFDRLRRAVTAVAVEVDRWVRSVPSNLEGDAAAFEVDPDPKDLTDDAPDFLPDCCVDATCVPLH